MKNPTVFVFLGEVESEEILRTAKRMHPTGAVFAMNALDEIRPTIARIQANEGGLKLNRVNIYTTIAAEDPSASELAEQAGEVLRDTFRKAFSAVDVTLAVLLSESNERDNIEMRDKNTYNFLTRMGEQRTTPLFNRIFLLSDKNEHGEILPGIGKKLYEMVAALPLLNSAQSHFCDLLAAKSEQQEQPLFASAGFWHPPPPQAEENQVLRKLAEVIEHELHDGEQRPSEQTAEPSVFSCASWIAGENRNCGISYEEIVNNIASVAAKPMNFWELWGRTIKEAEALLFGNEAAKFFERMYVSYCPEITFTSVREFETIPRSLFQVVRDEERLREAIFETESSIRALTNNIKQTEVSICRPKMKNNIDHIKDKIGEIYALLFAQQNLREKLSRQKNEHERLNVYLSHIRETITALKSLPDSPPHEAPSLPPETLAPISISLHRNDGLLRESHTLQTVCGDTCLLRVIGGFPMQSILAIAVL